MGRRIFQVDAFTNEIFGGNPAAVVLDADGLTKNQMQKIAREMNLSETAFVFKSSSDEYDYEVKFFTPLEEVELCGHATIATFYLMASKGIIKPLDDIVRVEQKTLAGILPVDIFFKNKKVYKIMMTQSSPQKLDTFYNVREIASILGIEAENIGINTKEVLPMTYSTGLSDIIVPIKSEDILSKMKPDFKRISQYSSDKAVVGIHAFTMKPGDKDSIYCRNFAPAYGIDEESATGTANGALSAYIIDNNLLDFTDNRLEITIKQGQYMERPSYINILVEREEKIKIKVGGEAVIVFEGIINL